MKQQLISHEPGHDRDLADAFDSLATATRSGDIVGFVAGIALRGRRYYVSIEGNLVRDPTFARGIAAAIDDELATMLHTRSASASTV